MKYLLFVLMLFVAACGENAQEKIKPSRFDPQFKMNVSFLKQDEITDFCTKLGVTYKANGCTKFNMETKECNVYVLEPRYVDDTDRLKIMGHETLHCMYGTYHQ